MRPSRHAARSGSEAAHARSIRSSARALQAPVELGGARLGEAGSERGEERRDEGRGRSVRAAGRRGYRCVPLVARTAGAAARERGRGGIDLEPDRRQHLGGDELGAHLGREPLAGDAAHQAAHVAPLAKHRCSAADAERLALARVLVRLVLTRRSSTRFEAAHVDGAHLASERGRREALGGGEPEGLVARRGDAAEEPHLRPAEASRDEGRLDPRQRGQCRIDAGQVGELACRQAGPLARVVGEAREAEVLPRARAHQRARDPSERAAQRRRAAERAGERCVGRLRSVATRRRERLRRAHRRLPRDRRGEAP
jgi:hypothetical protein